MGYFFINCTVDLIWRSKYERLDYSDQRLDCVTVGGIDSGLVASVDNVSAQPEYFYILMTLTALVGLVGRAARSCALPSAST